MKLINGTLVNMIKLMLISLQSKGPNCTSYKCYNLDKVECIFQW